jgi:hypothetical protein
LSIWTPASSFPFALAPEQIEKLFGSIERAFTRTEARTRIFLGLIVRLSID